jgi:Electron transfer DM13
MLALRLLSIPVVAGVTVLGLWITGGVLTDDATVSMALTAGWMTLVGLACLAIAVRRRELRWPVLGAYVAVALALGAYLAPSQLFDDVVDEQVATAAPAPPAAGEMRRAADRPRNVLLAQGRFEPVAHAAKGRASAIRLARGGRVLTLTGFEVDNGPDLRVRLLAGDDTGDHVDLGALKGNKGDQQYDILRGTDLDRYGTVAIWCRAFSVLFARAELEVSR